MRSTSYRLMAAITTGDTISVSLCKDTFHQGHKQASDLVSMRNVEPQHLWAALDDGLALMQALLHKDMANRASALFIGAAHRPPDALTEWADGARQEPIPDL